MGTECPSKHWFGLHEIPSVTDNGEHGCTLPCGSDRAIQLIALSPLTCQWPHFYDVLVVNEAWRVSCSILHALTYMQYM